MVKLTHTHDKNHPHQLQHFTLQNGLQLFLCPTQDQPYVETRIVVRAGSIDEQEGQSGLAHIIEHMLFKGSQRIGSLNPHHENILFQKTKKLLEEYQKNPSATLLKELQQNLKNSNQLTVPGELDRLYAAIGAQDINAYTNYNETVYQSRIPKTTLFLWLQLEQERFNHPLFRQYLSEMSVIYEEYNQDVDDDYSQAFETILKTFFQENPVHPIIGKRDDLKKLSLEKLEEFYQKYYVSSNMAIFLCGDFDPLSVVEEVEKIWERNTATPQASLPTRKTLIANPEPIVIHQEGSETSFVLKALFFPQLNTKEKALLSLLDECLTNEIAGILEQEFNYTQQLNSAESFIVYIHDSAIFFVYAETSTAQQTLQEVDRLLNDMLDQMKQGILTSLTPDLLKGVQKILAQDHLMSQETHQYLEDIIETFVQRLPLSELKKQQDFLTTITFQELQFFLNENLDKSWITLYKHRGKETVTPPLDLNIPSKYEFINANQQSDWANTFITKLRKDIPIQYQPDIPLQNIIEIDSSCSYTVNSKNQLFSLSIYFDRGYQQDPLLSLWEYLFNWLSSQKEKGFPFKQKQLYLALDVDAQVEKNQTILNISGNSQELSAMITWLEAKWKRPFLEKETYQKALNTLIHKRKEAIYNQYDIQQKLKLYSLYGTTQYGHFNFSNRQLKNIPWQKIAQSQKKLANLNHLHFFAAKNSQQSIKKLCKLFQAPFLASKKNSCKRIPPKYKYYDSPRILWTHYEMNQVEISLQVPQGILDKNEISYLLLFNEYMGNSTHSIVFNELRERQSLCYDANFNLEIPRYLSDPIILEANASVNPQNVMLVLDIFHQWLQTIPYDSLLFLVTKESLLRQLAQTKVRDRNLYSYNRRQIEMGVYKEEDHKKIFDSIKESTFEQLKSFCQDLLKNKNYTVTLLGEDKEIANILGQIKKKYPNYQQEKIDLKTLYPWNEK